MPLSSCDACALFCSLIFVFRSRSYCDFVADPVSYDDDELISPNPVHHYACERVQSSAPVEDRLEEAIHVLRDHAEV